MTTLCIDELPSRLKRRWNWPPTATNVPADADCPVLPAAASDEGRESPEAPTRAVVPAWLAPQRGFSRPPGIPGLHGKTSPSMG